MWCELDPQAFEGLGKLVGVLEPLGVGRPGRGHPDLRVVARADDDGFIAEVDVFAQVGRQQDPTLSVEFDHRGVRVPALDRVSFNIAPGAPLALVGESGSGKSVTAQAIMRILPPTATITSGEILFTSPGSPKPTTPAGCKPS